MASTGNPTNSSSDRRDSGRPGRPEQSKLILWCSSFYNAHFPTDRKSFNIRIPWLGLVVSLLYLHVVCDTILSMVFMASPNKILLIYAYILLASGVAYQLYWGLEINDRKQYMPWIIIKLLECILTIAAFACYISDYNQCRIDCTFDLIIYCVLIFVFNACIMYTVLRKYVNCLGRRRVETEPQYENIYNSVEI